MKHEILFLFICYILFNLNWDNVLLTEIVFERRTSGQYKWKQQSFCNKTFQKKKTKNKRTFLVISSPVQLLLRTFFTFTESILATKATQKFTWKKNTVIMKWSCGTTYFKPSHKKNMEEPGSDSLHRGHGGLVVQEADLCSEGRGFESSSHQFGHGCKGRGHAVSQWQ